MHYIMIIHFIISVIVQNPAYNFVHQLVDYMYGLTSC